MQVRIVHEEVNVSFKTVSSNNNAVVASSNAIDHAWSPNLRKAPAQKASRKAKLPVAKKKSDGSAKSSNAIDHALGPIVNQNQKKANNKVGKRAFSNAKLPVAKKARLDDNRNRSKKLDVTATSGKEAKININITIEKPRTKSMPRRGK